MKKLFFDLMHKILAEYPDVYLILAGLGYPRYDELKSKFGDRVINTEAAEQTALDMAVGLCYAGKIPIVYTISPFYLRAFETIRTYVNREELPVIMVGAGVDDDYSKHDGFSHDAKDLPQLFQPFDNITQHTPVTIDALENCIVDHITGKFPGFIWVGK